MHTPYMIHRTLPRASRRKHVGRPNPPWLIARDIRGGPAGASLLHKVHPKLHQLCFVIGSVIGSVIGRGAASGAVRRHGQRVLRATCRRAHGRSVLRARSARAARFLSCGTIPSFHPSWLVCDLAKSPKSPPNRYRLHCDGSAGRDTQIHKLPRVLIGSAVVARLKLSRRRSVEATNGAHKPVRRASAQDVAAAAPAVARGRAASYDGWSHYGGAALQLRPQHRAPQRPR